MKILVVEDDPILNKNIQAALEAEQYIVDVAFDGMLAERYLKKNNYDIVLLDINLPQKNGYEIAQNIRKNNAQTIIVMLTAFSDLEDKLLGFDAGADDYLTKPFFIKELLARLKSLQKRIHTHQTSTTHGNTISVADIKIDLDKKTVFRGVQEITLTPREFQILKLLCIQAGNIVSKQELLQEVWGNSFDTQTNTLEVYINFLRNKIDKPFGSNYIKTKIGFGYYLDI